MEMEMEISFVWEEDKFIVIYLYGRIVFSKYDDEHLVHLNEYFNKYRKFGLSLKPKKYQYAM